MNLDINGYLSRDKPFHEDTREQRIQWERDIGELLNKKIFATPKYKWIIKKFDSDGSLVELRIKNLVTRHVIFDRSEDGWVKVYSLGFCLEGCPVHLNHIHTFDSTEIYYPGCVMDLPEIMHMYFSKDKHITGYVCGMFFDETKTFHRIMALERWENDVNILLTRNEINGNDWYNLSRVGYNTISWVRGSMFNVISSGNITLTVSGSLLIHHTQGSRLFKGFLKETLEECGLNIYAELLPT